MRVVTNSSRNSLVMGKNTSALKFNLKHPKFIERGQNKWYMELPYHGTIHVILVKLDERMPDIMRANSINNDDDNNINHISIISMALDVNRTTAAGLINPRSSHDPREPTRRESIRPPGKKLG